VRLGSGAAALGWLLLAGCGQSDEQIKAGLRDELIRGCGREVAPAVAPYADPQAFCTCFAEQSIGTRGVAEFKAMADEEKARIGEQAAATCRAVATGERTDER